MNSFPRRNRARRPRKGRWVLLTIAIAAVAGLGFFSVSQTPSDLSGSLTNTAPPADPPYASDPAPAPASSPATEPTTTQEQLAQLAVKGRAPKNDYDREQFGQRWSDDVDVELGHDGCDTRNNILARDLNEVVYKLGTNDCVVAYGTFVDPFSGQEITFSRGQDTSRLVQIDHLVALADAWQKGAQQWDETTRRNFANDPRNLLAVDGRANQSKGASDAATWLPPNKAFRCEYATRIIDVKFNYGLWVTEAERAALYRQLETC